MHSNSQQRRVALEVALKREALEQAAAQRRLLAMAETGQPTPPVEAEPISTKAATACCEGRPAGHTGQCWPLGATHPAS